MARRPPRSQKRPARRSGKRWLLVLALLVLAVLAIWQWLVLLPDASSDAPAATDDPSEPSRATPKPERIAMTTALQPLPADPAECRAELDRSGAAFTILPPAGEGACIHTDRTALTDFPLTPDIPPVTCPVAVGLVRWREEVAAPAARDIMGSELKAIEHFGAYSCRRRNGSEEGEWSEHATGNAIDVGGFVLADGRRISVLDDWHGEGTEARFLRAVRDGGCAIFGTVISPDSDPAHADHLHFDQKARRGGLCQ